MGRLNLDAIPEKPLRKMKDLFALLDEDDRQMILEAVEAGKDTAAIREQVQLAYPELQQFELKSWVNWANNYRAGRTCG